MAFHFLTDKGDIPSNWLPPDTATIFGGGGFGSGAQMLDAGNIYRNIIAAGIHPGSTGSDYVVDVFALPAGTLDAVGRGVSVNAVGGVATGTNTKRIKLYWNVTAPVVGSVVSGGTVFADTGSYATTGATGYSLSGSVYKAAANSQLLIHESALIGTTVGPTLIPTTAAATDTGIIWIAVTAAAGTTATDITHYFTQIFGTN